MPQSPTQKTQLTVAVIGALGLVIVAFIGKCNFTTTDGNKVGVLRSRLIAKGIVVDESTNQNISLAEVTLVGRNEKSTTDQSGNFKITLEDSLPEIRIRVHKTQYLPYDNTFTLPNDNIFIQLKKDESH